MANIIIVELNHQQMQLLSLHTRGDRVGVDTPASIITFIYSKYDKRSVEIVNMLRSIPNNECNLYLVDADINNEALKLLSVPIPSVVAFRNHQPICYLQSEITLPNILQFWQQLASDKLTKNNPKNTLTKEIIVHCATQSNYKTLTI